MALNLYSNDASYLVQYSLVASEKCIIHKLDICWKISIHTCTSALGLFIHNSIKKITVQTQECNLNTPRILAEQCQYEIKIKNEILSSATFSILCLFDRRSNRYFWVVHFNICSPCFP